MQEKRKQHSEEYRCIDDYESRFSANLFLSQKEANKKKNKAGQSYTYRSFPILYMHSAMQSLSTASIDHLVAVMNT